MLIVGGGFRFACETGAGAVLVLKDHMHGERMICSRQVKEYVRKHVESWYIFLDRLGLRDELGQQDILMVTGRSITSDWGVAAFTQKRNECSIDFHTGLGTSSAHLALGGSWANAHAVEHRSGPVTGIDIPQLPIVDRSTHSSRTPQVVFVRGLYARVRNFRLPIKIKAAAEPQDDDHNSSDQDDAFPAHSVMDSDLDVFACNTPLEKSAQISHIEDLDVGDFGETRKVRCIQLKHHGLLLISDRSKHQRATSLTILWL